MQAREIKNVEKLMDSLQMHLERPRKELAIEFDAKVV